MVFANKFIYLLSENASIYLDYSKRKNIRLIKHAAILFTVLGILLNNFTMFGHCIPSTD